MGKVRRRDARIHHTTRGFGGRHPLCHQHPVFCHHPAAARRLRHHVHCVHVGRRRQRLGGRHPGSTGAIRAGQTHDRPVLPLDRADTPWQLRHGNGMEPAGQGRDRRPPDADRGGVAGRRHLHLGARPPHRHLFRREALLDRRLHLHLHRFHRLGRAGFHAGADRPVCRFPLFQCQRGRPVLAGVLQTRPGAGSRSKTCSSTCRSRRWFSGCQARRR